MKYEIIFCNQLTKVAAIFPADFDDNDTSGNSSLTLTSEPSPLKLMYDPMMMMMMEEGGQTSVKNLTNLAICPLPPPPAAATNPRDIQELLKNAEQITEFCRLRDTPENEDEELVGEFAGGGGGGGGGGIVEMSRRQQQSAQKLRKVIVELIETEKTYVRDLNCLVSRYLEPLQNESFLSADEVSCFSTRMSVPGLFFSVTWSLSPYYLLNRLTMKKTSHVSPRKSLSKL